MIPFIRLTVILMTLAVTVNTFAADVQQKGVTPGAWTQDYDEALTYAKKNKLPVLLNFTGSDWCKFCIMMEKKVFSTDTWKAYAQKNLIMVYIDFPKDKTKVSADYATRNKKLSKEYSVGGYPTFILLDGSAGYELGRLSTTDSTQAFIKKIEAAARYSETSINKDYNAVSEGNKKTFLKTGKALIKIQGELSKLQKDVALLTSNQADLRKTFDDIHEQEKIRRLGPKKDAYIAAKEELKSLKNKMNAWIKTNPPRNSESQKKYKSFMTKIKEATAKVDSF